ncbi:hypothetical protein V5O48_005450 [Marasmius crinis-equi]|uniref:Amidase domain-containing protein n=1 Tax=Marasmius crinis-equi TaxID=585013 RepID=A0ABR3FMA9_9AGAR
MPILPFAGGTALATGASSLPDLYEASVLELQHGLYSGLFTSVDLVKAYIARIEEVNLHGPALRAVIEVNPSALKQAAELDRERKRYGKRTLLHGIPVLLKDNIGTIASEGMNTTAGSFSLLRSVVPDDAGVVKKLRKAGAIILGKTNMSEFSHARSDTLPSGWSGRGGQNTNAYFPSADPCGSSSGSGVAVLIGLAAVTLGSDTGGSITCPSSRNNAVGIKPTVGLTSRAGGRPSFVPFEHFILLNSILVIPISTNQDSIGPMTRSVSDAAIVLSLIAGKDPKDNFTLAQPGILPDYVEALDVEAFKGKRIGVPRKGFLDEGSIEPPIATAFEEALETIRGLGATIVDPADLPSAQDILNSTSEASESLLLLIDFKVQLNAYYEALLENPSGARSLDDLIAFNNANPDLEEPVNFTDQSTLIAAQATNGFNESYFTALWNNHDLGRTRGIDAAMREHKLDALMLPASFLSVTPAAIAGYPVVTVPLGFLPDDTAIGTTGLLTVYPAPGVPFGLSFFGGAYSEFDLVGFGFAYEQKTKTRLKRRALPEAIPKTQL